MALPFSPTPKEPAMTRTLPAVAIALLLAGCHATAPDSAAITYACDDGRHIQASYPDTEHATLVIDGQSHPLHLAVAASGARYVGDNLQWWTKGMHEAWLAPLAAGETVASAPGVACRGG